MLDIRSIFHALLLHQLRKSFSHFLDLLLHPLRRRLDLGVDLGQHVGLDLRRVGLEFADEALGLAEERELDLIALDDAMKTMAEFDPRQSRIVELRFFGGLSIEETAEVLGISPATVKREWSTAKMWLHRELSKQ